MRAAQITEELTELANNLWWSWNNDALALWERIALLLPATQRESLVRNPTLLVRNLKKKHLSVLASDSDFERRHRRVLAKFRRATKQASRVRGLSWKHPIAYFSMEFGLHESLPVYAGGLGILAGDHAKSSSDEGVPLVGVGMLYRKGYFEQRLDSKGKMEVRYPSLDFGKMPVELVKDRSGKELRVIVELPDGKVKVRVWRVAAGQVPLYLLDTDIPANGRPHRAISQHLYGGSREDRIRQEIVLGIGGVRVLKALGFEPGVWHLNEGHVAFLTLERLRDLRRESGLNLAESLEVLAADTVFTTHTPVPEGNEVFDIALVARYLNHYCDRAGIPIEEYLELGLDDTGDYPVFSMTVLALRLSRFRNGVSALHGEVARAMWSFLWPSLQEEEVPIGSVTNGVHTSAWVAPQIEVLLSEAIGNDWASRLTEPAAWKNVRKISNRKLWTAKRELKKELVDFVRQREDRRLARLGQSPARRRAAVADLLDPDALTIGFARRFALYKRAALIFKDVKRAARIFGSKKRPVQILFAGKPHPEDAEGKKVFEEVARFARRKEFRGKVVVLENYDTEVCRYMVRGVDVWLNNPRRPLEASGTSGQKVPINGGLNMSILDGWWCEGYAPGNGWAFGNPQDYEDTKLQDKDDAEDLYRVLEREVLPLYYERSRGALPSGWLKMLKSSMAALVPQFSSNRMVVEYAERLYLPALANGRAIRARKAARARELTSWQSSVLRSMPLVHVRGGEVARDGTLVLEMFLGSIDPAHLICCDYDGHVFPVEVDRATSPGVYRLKIGASAAHQHLRLVPTHPDLVHPQELGVAIDLVS